MDLWEIRVEFPADAAAGVEETLLEHGFGDWTLVEDALVRRAWLVGVFEGDAQARSRWAALRPLLTVQGLGDAPVRRLPESEWKDSYRSHFKAWTFGRLHWVPIWERGSFQLPQGHEVLWLDPGLAFGTGNHETTRLCIERIVDLAAEHRAEGNGSLVDAGCGSGILALSACLLGFRDVYGFDIDPEAARVSLENADLNRLSDRVRFGVAGLPDGLGSRPVEVVVANIQADVLMGHARSLAAGVAPGGRLILSGILATEIDAVRSAFRPETAGWAFDSRVLGEWCDACLRRPGP